MCGMEGLEIKGMYPWEHNSDEMSTTELSGRNLKSKDI